MFIRLLCGILFLTITHFGNGQDVYRTPSGTKYHLASCRMVENVSHKISVEAALKAGLQPCKLCKPTVSNHFISTKVPIGRSNTVRCKGLTKKGIQCQHMTSIANGYCYQHNPK